MNMIPVLLGCACSSPSFQVPGLLLDLVEEDNHGSGNHATNFCVGYILGLTKYVLFCSTWLVMSHRCGLVNGYTCVYGVGPGVYIAYGCIIIENKLGSLS